MTALWWSTLITSLPWQLWRTLQADPCFFMFFFFFNLGGQRCQCCCFFDPLMSLGSFDTTWTPFHVFPIVFPSPNFTSFLVMFAAISGRASIVLGAIEEQEKFLKEKRARKSASWADIFESCVAWICFLVQFLVSQRTVKKSNRLLKQL